VSVYSLVGVHIPVSCSLPAGFGVVSSGSSATLLPAALAGICWGACESERALRRLAGAELAQVLGRLSRALLAEDADRT
jgi:hypothetical protein